MPVIEIVVSKKGDTEIRAEGFPGASCENATKQIENLLGMVDSRVHTAEYAYVPEQEARHQHLA